MQRLRTEGIEETDGSQGIVYVECRLNRTIRGWQQCDSRWSCARTCQRRQIYTRGEGGHDGFCERGAYLVSARNWHSKWYSLNEQPLNAEQGALDQTLAIHFQERWLIQGDRPQQTALSLLRIHAKATPAPLEMTGTPRPLNASNRTMHHTFSATPRIGAHSWASRSERSFAFCAIFLPIS